MKKIIAMFILTIASASSFAGSPPPPPVALQVGQSVLWCAIEAYPYQAAQDINDAQIAAYNGTLTISNDNHTYTADWPFTVSGLSVGQTGVNGNSATINAEVCVIVTKTSNAVRLLPVEPFRP